MACNSQFTTNDLLTSLGIYDSSCSKKLTFINRALRVFYSRVWDLQVNQHMQSIPLPEGDSNFTTTFPIYKVRGFYGRGKGPAFEKIAGKIDYNCEGCTVKRLTFNRGTHFLDDWQYKLDTTCDDKIFLRIPCDVTNGSIIYSRGPANITSIGQNIIMPNHLRTGFEFLVEEMWSSRVEELNNTSYRNSQFERWLENQEKMEESAPEFIGYGN